ncbi:MAG: hypothetical protein AAGB31_11285 [Bdellovibrio sp.]
MNKPKVLFQVVMIAMFLSLGACAKKDSEFASRYSKNKMGARVVDGSKTQTAGESAAAQGLEADIVGLSLQANGDVNTVTAMILINNYQMPVTTTHGGTETVEGTTTINGYQVAVHAMCGNTSCDTYFIAMEVYKNGTMLIQEGVKKYFVSYSTEDQDVYNWFTPAEALPFIGAHSMDTKGMVGYLNTAAASGNSSSIVK